MVSVLTWLTLVVVFIVVLALVYYLVNIILALRRAGDHLEKLAGGLEAIRDNSQPLLGNMTTINDALVRLLAGLQAVDANLVNIARVLSR
ncbi:MAG: hypothetical protein ACE5LU_13580 [Anaerolineae bacterium]